MQRGSVLPIVLILIVLSAVAIGVYYIQNSNTYSRSDASENLKTPYSASPSPKVNTVSDDLLKLQLTLPEGYNLIKETEEEYFVRANGKIRQNFNYYVKYEPAGFAEAFYIIPDGEKNLDKAVLTVWAFENPNGLNTEKFYDNYWYYPFVWGDYTARRNDIAPEKTETISGLQGKSGVVTYREGKPQFIYLPLESKKLMLQIQLPIENNEVGKNILQSFKFE